jgi:biotin carboxyl carrier protein
MNDASWPLRADVEGEGVIVLRSPGVGVWLARPADGSLIGPGASGGSLRQVGRRIALTVPEGVAGRVAIHANRDREIAVAYGEVLFRVQPVDGAAAAATSAKGVAASDSGALHVTSPTDGVFYRAPSQGAKAYVTVGERIATGHAVGLIEVMKTFNPILYGGSGWPESVEVVAVLAEDGQEVRAGQPLVSVR